MPCGTTRTAFILPGCGRKLTRKFVNCRNCFPGKLSLDEYVIMIITRNHICAYPMLAKFGREGGRQADRFQARVDV